MPKPPVDHSQVTSVKIDYPFSEEWLNKLHQDVYLMGDVKLFIEDVRAAYRVYILSRKYFVEAKEHRKQFDRLESNPGRYVNLMRTQERIWLRRAGWEGSEDDVGNYITQARRYIPFDQDAFSYREFGENLVDIWLRYEGSQKKYESLNVTNPDKRDYSGFPFFISQIMGKVGREFPSVFSLKSFINQIWK